MGSQAGSSHAQTVVLSAYGDMQTVRMAMMRTVQTAKDRIEVRIRDTGAGIARE